MATITAVKSGNFNDSSVWDSGTVPGIGDDACTGAYEIAVTASVDLGVGKFLAEGPGFFNFNTGGITVTAAAFQYNNSTAVTNGIFRITASTGNDITLNGDVLYADAALPNGGRSLVLSVTCGVNVILNGNITGGKGTSNCRVENNSAKKLKIIGNVAAGTTGSYGIYKSSTGSVEIIGNVYGGSATNAYGIYNASTGPIKVTGDVYGGGGNSAYGITSSSGSVEIIGNVYGGSASSTYGVYNSSTGSVEIIGNVYGGSASSTYGVYNSSGSVEVTGNVYGGTSITAHGISNTSGALIKVTGDVFGGSSGSGISNTNSTVEVIGNVIGKGGNGISNGVAGTIKVTGDVFGGNSSSTYGVSNSSTGSVEIIGNVYGGSASSTYGVYNSSTGPIKVTGDVYGGIGSSSYVNQYGLYNNSTSAVVLIEGDVYPGQESTYTVPGVSNNGVMTITGTIFGSIAGPSNPGQSMSPTILTAKTSETKIYGYVYGPEGDCPIQGRVIFIDAPDNLVKVRTYNDYKEKILGGPRNPDELPAPEDVRDGVVYNYGVYEGTCVVPGPESVAAGVLVDDTVGIAVITSSQLEILETILRSSFYGKIEIEENTPTEGFVTFKFYKDDETNTLFKTITINKNTGARSRGV